MSEGDQGGIALAGPTPQAFSTPHLATATAGRPFNPASPATSPMEGSAAALGARGSPLHTNGVVSTMQGVVASPTTATSAATATAPAAAAVSRPDSPSMERLRSELEHLSGISPLMNAAARVILQGTADGQHPVLQNPEMAWEDVNMGNGSGPSPLHNSVGAKRAGTDAHALKLSDSSHPELAQGLAATSTPHRTPASAMELCGLYPMSDALRLVKCTICGLRIRDSAFFEHHAACVHQQQQQQQQQRADEAARAAAAEAAAAEAVLKEEAAALAPEVARPPSPQQSLPTLSLDLSSVTAEPAPDVITGLPPLPPMLAGVDLSDLTLPGVTSTAFAPSAAKPRKPKRDRAINLDVMCGVFISERNDVCMRALSCKAHPQKAKRAVEGRSRPFEELLAAHMERKSVARPRKRDAQGVAQGQVQGQAQAQGQPGLDAVTATIKEPKKRSRTKSTAGEKAGTLKRKAAPLDAAPAAVPGKKSLVTRIRLGRGRRRSKAVPLATTQFGCRTLGDHGVTWTRRSFLASEIFRKCHADERVRMSHQQTEASAPCVPPVFHLASSEPSAPWQDRGALMRLHPMFGTLDGKGDYDELFPEPEPSATLESAESGTSASVVKSYPDAGATFAGAQAPAPAAAPAKAPRRRNSTRKSTGKGTGKGTGKASGKGSGKGTGKGSTTARAKRKQPAASPATAAQPQPTTGVQTTQPSPTAAAFQQVPPGTSPPTSQVRLPQAPNPYAQQPAGRPAAPSSPLYGSPHPGAAAYKQQQQQQRASFYAQQAQLQQRQQQQQQQQGGRQQYATATVVAGGSPPKTPGYPQAAGQYVAARAGPRPGFSPAHVGQQWTGRMAVSDHQGQAHQQQQQQQQQQQRQRQLMQQQQQQQQRPPQQYATYTSQASTTPSPGTQAQFRTQQSTAAAPVRPQSYAIQQPAAQASPLPGQARVARPGASVYYQSPATTGAQAMRTVAASRAATQHPARPQQGYATPQAQAQAQAQQTVFQATYARRGSYPGGTQQPAPTQGQAPQPASCQASQLHLQRQQQQAAALQQQQRQRQQQQRQQQPYYGAQRQTYQYQQAPVPQQQPAAPQ